MHKFKIKVVLILLLVGSVQAKVFAFNSSEITYDSLANNVWTDHVRAFKCLFNLMPVSSFLEFGTGRGTKYFLDNCENVTSLELSIQSRGDRIYPWYLLCKEAYKDYTNWQPLFHKASDTFDFYNQQTALNYWNRNLTHLPDRLNEYKLEVAAICNDVLKIAKFEVAFVDPGIVTRADLVKELFGKVDIIVAHDTNDSLYGWASIVVPADYEMINFSYGSGTTFWIKSTKQELILNLRRELQN